MNRGVTASYLTKILRKYVSKLFINNLWIIQGPE